MSEQGALDLPEDTLDLERAMLEAQSFADATDLRKWPERLLEIVNVFEAALRRSQAAQLTVRQMAEMLALELGRNQGGRPVYLPTGEQLENVLRARRIYHRVGTSDGAGGKLTIDQIATIEGVCVQQAYKDYAMIRALERARLPKLF